MGGALGYYIAYLFTKLLPSREEIDENCRQAGKIVTGMRRVWAVLFDYVFLWLFTDFPIIIARWLADGQSESVNAFVLLFLLLVSRIYFVIYFIKEAVLKGERPMAHDKLSGTAYMAVEIPQKSPAEL